MNKAGHNDGRTLIVDKAGQLLKTFGPICIFDASERILIVSKDVQRSNAASPMCVIWFDNRSNTRNREQPKNALRPISSIHSGVLILVNE